MNYYPPNQHRSVILVVLFFLFFNKNISAQCAGTNQELTICDKYNDSIPRFYELLPVIGGDAGGFWTVDKPEIVNAIDRDTGILDLYNLNYFGEHVFTYTNPICNESASVTLHLGGYPGEDNTDGSASACNMDYLINLHGYLGSNLDEKKQDLNGDWTVSPSSASNLIDGSIFQVELAEEGTYTFTYTTEAHNECPERFARVILQVYAGPEPAASTENLSFSIEDDLSGYTNHDLFSQLEDEESGGFWNDLDETNQLSDLLDHHINIEEIRDTFGAGSYSFSYTVLSDNPVCDFITDNIQIDIIPVFRGELSIDDDSICPGVKPIITVSYNPLLIPDGNYTLDVEISDAEQVDAGSYIAKGEGEFANGTATIVVDTRPGANQNLTMNLVGISGEGFSINDDIPIDVNAISFATPASSIEISGNTCPNNDLNLNITSFRATDGSFLNGTTDVIYLLTYPDRTEKTITVSDVSFSNGEAEIIIPAGELQSSGTYNIDFDTAYATEECPPSNSFSLGQVPEDIYLNLELDSKCDATQVEITVDAPELSNGEYAITYEIIESNSSEIILENTLNFRGGATNLTVNFSTLPEGEYFVNLRSAQTDITPCRSQTEFELQESFLIGNNLRTPTVTNETQSFCLLDFETPPTLADIEVNGFGTLRFFEDEASEIELASGTVLEHNKTYFIDSFLAEDCESPQRARVTVLLVAPATIDTNENNPTFCIAENPTLASLDAQAANGGNVVWYDAPTEGNQLSLTDALVSGSSYYAAEQVASGCESTTRTEFIPQILTPELAVEIPTALEWCELDNRTVADLMALSSQETLEVFWYAQQSGGLPLEANAGLNDTIYYAEVNDLSSLCTNPIRIAVNVTLNNCEPPDIVFPGDPEDPRNNNNDDPDDPNDPNNPGDPSDPNDPDNPGDPDNPDIENPDNEENRRLFIPNAFSPNGDGVNDTFYIPNIQFFFPDYSIQIFNRYGATVFEGNAENPSWNGENATEGVYFFVLNFNREGIKNRQGKIFLNR